MTGSPTCAPAQRFGIDSDFGLDYLPKSNTPAAEWSERWGFGDHDTTSVCPRLYPADPEGRH